MIDLQFYRNRVKVTESVYLSARDRYEFCDAENQWDRLRGKMNAAKANFELATNELRIAEQMLATFQKLHPTEPDPQQPNLL